MVSGLTWHIKFFPKNLTIIITIKIINEFQKTNENDQGNPCPMSKSSYLSQLVYFWAESLIWRGYKKPLVLTDVWDLDSSMSSSGLVPEFDAALKPLIEKSKVSKKGFSILPALTKTFGASFFLGAAMQIIVGG